MFQKKEAIDLLKTIVAPGHVASRADNIFLKTSSLISSLISISFFKEFLLAGSLFFVFLDPNQKYSFPARSSYIITN